MKRFRPLAAFVIALLATLTLNTAAHAQMMGGLGRSDPVSTADIQDMSEFLSFTDDQRATALDMHTAYLSTFEENRDTLYQAINAIQEEFQQTQDMSIFEEMQKMVVEFEKTSKGAADRLFEDIQLILTEEQLENWPAFELRSFRKRTLPTVSNGGMNISGATTDLIDIYEQHIESDVEDDDVRESLLPLLASYEREMDAVLHEYVEVRNEVTEDSLEIGMDWMANMDKIDEIIKTYIGAAVKIRDINDRYTGRIASILSGDTRKSWENEFNVSASPSVYTDNYIDQSFNAARELTSLTEEQRERVEELRRRYLASESSVNAKWAAALRESEENLSFSAMMQGQMQSPEVGELRKERGDLDARTYDELAAVLTEEQREALPAKPAANWRDRFQFNTGG
ncbi:unnamed protein product [Symbiodinium necroappetens]|uniref:Uncharacterized protein n=1 Tax=Symbiodinium necroappetens TaxID=1628268 RepID=A0A812MT88_9DINO|nr:unnamed protein product [Symbiodinium necroappetens]